jgi:hypothetical protein
VFYELRQYRIQPGQMDAWIKLFEEEILPFQVSKGMVISGCFQGEEDKSVWVWIRRFESEAERERLYRTVYESDEWKNVIVPKIQPLMDRTGMNVQRIVPTQASVLR